MKRSFTRLAAGFVFLMFFSVAAMAEGLNLNSATAAEIAETMVGIGPAKAEAIVKDREANGNFKNLDDLARVKGIGSATIEKNRGKITVK